MAVDMFLKLEGIKGESKDEHGHADQIDVLAWSWGLSNSGTAHSGTGAGAGKVNVQDISLTKWVDRASINLIQYCATGKHIKSAHLVVRKAGGTPLEYIKIDFDDLLVSSVSTGGSGGEDRLTENISLNFAKFKVEYFTQAKDGTGASAGEVTYNIPGNKQT